MVGMMRVGSDHGLGHHLLAFLGHMRSLYRHMGHVQCCLELLAPFTKRISYYIWYKKDIACNKKYFVIPALERITAMSLLLCLTRYEALCPIPLANTFYATLYYLACAVLLQSDCTFSVEFKSKTWILCLRIFLCCFG